MRIEFRVAAMDAGDGLAPADGYREISDFNGNPVAVFWGEKRLASSQLALTSDRRGS